MPSIEQGIIRDGLALIEAQHRGGLEAVRVLVDNCDLRPVVVFLAGVADDLIGDLSAWIQQPADGMFAILRQHHTGAGTVD